MKTLRIGIAGLWLMAHVSLVTAADTAPVSPALDPYPQTLIQNLSGCLTRGEFLGATPLAIRQLERWLGEFQSPQYANLLSRIEHVPTGQRRVVINNARGWVARLRRHVDFHTEQALIALLDVEARRHRWSADCGSLVAQAIQSVAAQRDYAWAWADAMDRIFAMEGENGTPELQYRQWQVEDGLDQIAVERRRLERYDEDVRAPYLGVDQDDRHGRN